MVRGRARRPLAGSSLSHPHPPPCRPPPLQVYSPYSKAGHQLAAFTTKGPNAYLFVLSATDKQWGGGGEATLRKMLDAFRA